MIQTTRGFLAAGTPTGRRRRLTQRLAGAGLLAVAGSAGAHPSAAPHLHEQDPAGMIAMLALMLTLLALAAVAAVLLASRFRARAGEDTGVRDSRQRRALQEPSASSSTGAPEPNHDSR